MNHAYHQAGHAVVAREFGWEVDPEDDLTRSIAYHLAGAVAESRYLKHGYWRVLKGERGLGPDGVLGDLDAISELLDLPVVYIRKAQLGAAVHLVQRILTRRWAEIEALVQEKKEFPTGSGATGVKA